MPGRSSEYQVRIAAYPCGAESLIVDCCKREGKQASRQVQELPSLACTLEGSLRALGIAAGWVCAVCGVRCL
jgi:hypothetical protein